MYDWHTMPLPVSNSVYASYNFIFKINKLINTIFVNLRQHYCQSYHASRVINVFSRNLHSNIQFTHISCTPIQVCVRLSHTVKILLVDYSRITITTVLNRDRPL